MKVDSITITQSRPDCDQLNGMDGTNYEDEYLHNNLPSIEYYEKQKKSTTIFWCLASNIMVESLTQL